MAANIKNLDSVINHIASFTNVSKVEILEKESSKHVICVCSLANGDVLENVKKFLTDRESENNSETWFCKVYLKGNNTKSVEGKDYVGFSFQLCERQRIAVNGPINPPAASDKSQMEMYMELGYLRAENRRLVQENQILQSDIETLEAELEGAEVSGPEDPMEKYKQYAELATSFMPVLNALGFGASVARPNVVNGVEDLELNSIVSELQKVDENLKENLFKLLKLAKDKPMMYKMAVGYLNNL